MMNASNSRNGTFRTTPRKTMEAFDNLPSVARQILANAFYNWATQPILRGYRGKNRQYGSANRIVRSVKLMDLEQLKEDGARLMEYAVMAESHGGEITKIKDGFVSATAAEQHPIRLADWKRVWVAPINVPAGASPKKPTEPAVPTLPPKPWDWVMAGTPTGNGKFQAYLVDATGRKIAAIWGKSGEKELIGDHILKCCNSQ
jgi:hypothetical protein